MNNTVTAVAPAAPKMTFICRDCGSPEVRWDGSLAWDPVNQFFSVVTEYDNHDCATEAATNCTGCETRTKRVGIDQDCKIIEHPDIPGKWAVSYDGFYSGGLRHGAARTVQREWREHVGRNIETGEPISRNDNDNEQDVDPNQLKMF